VRTSEKTIIRIKDLAEQAASRFVILPGSLDRVIIACNYYEIQDGVVTAYMDEGLQPIFSMPVANGFVLIDRTLTDTESLAQTMTRMYQDEKEAERMHDELTKDDPAHKHDGHPKGGKILHLKPGQIDPRDHQPEDDRPFPGQYA
jgi:hypothetical protein